MNSTITLFTNMVGSFWLRHLNGSSFGYGSYNELDYIVYRSDDDIPGGLEMSTPRYGSKAVTSSGGVVGLNATPNVMMVRGESNIWDTVCTAGNSFHL